MLQRIRRGKLVREVCRREGHVARISTCWEVLALSAVNVSDQLELCHARRMPLCRLGTQRLENITARCAAPAELPVV